MRPQDLPAAAVEPEQQNPTGASLECAAANHHLVEKPLVLPHMGLKTHVPLPLTLCRMLRKTGVFTVESVQSHCYVSPVSGARRRMVSESSGRTPRLGCHLCALLDARGSAAAQPPPNGCSTCTARHTMRSMSKGKGLQMAPLKTLQMAPLKALHMATLKALHSPA